VWKVPLKHEHVCVCVHVCVQVHQKCITLVGITDDQPVLIHQWLPTSQHHPLPDTERATVWEISKCHSTLCEKFINHNTRKSNK